MHIGKEFLDYDGRQYEATRVTAFEGDENPLVMKKLVPREELAALGAFLHSRHQVIAYATGVYDLIHVGHVRFLELARQQGDVLVVGLNSDESVRTYKDPDRPILPEAVRAEMLCYLASVDYVTIYPETTGVETMKLLQPDSYLCVEGSWNGNLESKAEVQEMLKLGGKVYYSPRQSPTVSTSAVIDKISQLERKRVIAELRKGLE